MLEAGQLVMRTPLTPLALDYPGVGSVRCWTIGSPEAITLHRHAPGLRSNRNVVIAPDATIAALQDLSGAIREGGLDLAQAAMLVAAAPPTPLSMPATPGPPGLFAWARGRSGGRATTVAASPRAPFASAYAGAGAMLGAAAAIFAAGGLPSGAFSVEDVVTPDTYFDLYGRISGQRVAVEVV